LRVEPLCSSRNLSFRGRSYRITRNVADDEYLVFAGDADPTRDRELGAFRITRANDGSLRAYAVRMWAEAGAADSRFLLSLARLAIEQEVIPIVDA
jgi:hypothetical protein